ncbi:hypothetical protein [Pseudomonas pseudonitroreducens]|uniref:hypothetical protein n=1 Tax=Pseudomonas pseudonitroreducens TaxID=2892326 RepID=UPI001F4902C7|nr:hypothetical protein [Pseudomonas pseudonitroreducens]
MEVRVFSWAPSSNKKAEHSSAFLFSAFRLAKNSNLAQERAPSAIDYRQLGAGLLHIAGKVRSYEKARTVRIFKP